jgi:hypothetical protein
MKSFFLLTWIILIIILPGCNNSNCEDGYDCVKSGTPWRLSVTGFDESIDGLTYLNWATAYLVLDNTNDTILLDAKAFDNDKWDEEIFVPGLSVKNVSVTDIEDPLKINVEIQTPSESSLIGSRGTIFFTFDVIYPDLIGSDDILTRSIHNKLSKFLEDGKYYDHEKEFTYETKIKIIEQKEQ